MDAIEARFRRLEMAVASLAAGETPDVTDQLDALLERLRAIGLTKGVLRLQIPKALVAGVQPDVIFDHYSTILAKYPDVAAATDDGHGANWAMSRDVIANLLAGVKLGYTGVSATPADQFAAFGYTQADIDAASSLPENKKKFITDYLLFVASNGERGWRARAHDSRGASSDDALDDPVEGTPSGG